MGLTLRSKKIKNCFCKPEEFNMNIFDIESLGRLVYDELCKLNLFKVNVICLV